jgi:hypothetical protein
VRSRLCAFTLLTVLLSSALALSGCGTNPPAQAEPAPSSIVLPTPPPMPTSPPRIPTPTPPPAPAAPAPAGAGATLLADDFDTATDLRAWTVIDGADPIPGPSVWRIQNGHLLQVSDANDAPGLYPTALVSGDPTWRDYRVSVAGFVTQNEEVGVVARATDAGYYVFKLLPSTLKPGMVLARYDAATQALTTLAQADGGGFVARRWYRLRLEVRGEQLQAYVNDQPVLSARDATLAQGRAGVYGYAEGGLEFDNLTVQALAASGQP